MLDLVETARSDSARRPRSLPGLTLALLAASGAAQEVIPSRWSLGPDGVVEWLPLGHPDHSGPIDSSDSTSFAQWLDRLAAGSFAPRDIALVIERLAAVLQGGLGAGSAGRCLRRLGCDTSLWTTAQLFHGTRLPWPAKTRVQPEILALGYLQYAATDLDFGAVLPLPAHVAAAIPASAVPILERIGTRLDPRRRAPAAAANQRRWLVPAGNVPVFAMRVLDPNALTPLLEAHRGLLFELAKKEIRAQGASTSPATLAAMQLRIDAADLFGLQNVLLLGPWYVDEVVVWRTAGRLSICVAGGFMLDRLHAWARAAGFDSRALPTGIVVETAGWSLACAAKIEDALRGVQDAPPIEIEPILTSEPADTALEWQMTGREAAGPGCLAFRSAAGRLDDRSETSLRFEFASDSARASWLGAMRDLLRGSREEFESARDTALALLASARIDEGASGVGWTRIPPHSLAAALVAVGW
jgi:hypothetical protein